MAEPSSEDVAAAASVAATRELVLRILAAQGVRHAASDDSPERIDIPLRTPPTSWMRVKSEARILLAPGLIEVVACSGYRVAPPYRPAAAALIAALTYDLRSGCVEMDVRDGEVRYRTDIPLPLPADVEAGAGASASGGSAAAAATVRADFLAEVLESTLAMVASNYFVALTALHLMATETETMREGAVSGAVGEKLAAKQLRALATAVRPMMRS